MELKYTEHLAFRLRIRKIPHDLPYKIFRDAKEHYYDTQTNHYIAVCEVKFEGKIREMALSYDRHQNLVEIITVHPIKSYQKHGRISSGRWKKQ